jgi:hypothetical protein
LYVEGKGVGGFAAGLAEAVAGDSSLAPQPLNASATIPATANAAFPDKSIIQFPVVVG